MTNSILANSPKIDANRIEQLTNKYKNYIRTDNNSGSILSDGIEVLYMYLSLIGNRGKVEFEKLRAKADVSRDSQEQSNAIDSVIAECNTDPDPNKAKRDVPESAIHFMKAIGLTVNGKPIDKYIEENSGKSDNKLDKGKLMAIKAALDTHSARATDFVSQSQLKIQNTMQTYNVTTTLLNSLQSMLAEMNKMIAQNIK